LTKNGVDPGKVAVKNLDTQVLPAALCGGDIAAFFIWQPGVAHARDLPGRIDQNRSLPGEAITRKRLGKKAVQAIEEANGEKLAVERMRVLGPMLVNLGLRFGPTILQDGMEIDNPNKDIEWFRECTRLGTELLKTLAQYQSPKLQAVMVQQVDDQPKQQTLRLTVDIFDDSGRLVEQVVDGTGRRSRARRRRLAMAKWEQRMTAKVAADG
jgi:hypothetical protein